MRKPAKKKNNLTFLGIMLVIVLLLFLAANNIESYLIPNDVLGLSTETAKNEEASTDQFFWENFLTDNPEYVPGWIELGRFDKVKEIGPNYQVVFQEYN